MGFCPASVVVHQIYVCGVSALEPENDAPVARDIDGVVASQSTLQRMQPISGTAQMLEAICRRDVGEYQFYPLEVLRMNPASITSFVQALQSAMPEANDHSKCRSDKYNLSIVVV